MKKSVLCLLLAMLMCLSVFFVSCDKDDKVQQDIANAPSEDNSTPNEETPKVDVAKGKAVLVEYLKANDLSSIDMSLDFDENEMTEALETVLSNLECGGDLTVDMTANGQSATMDITTAFKKGLMYAGADADVEGLGSDFQEVYVLIRGLEILNFEKDENGDWYLAGTENIGMPSDSVGTEDLSAVLALLEMVEFQDVTQDDIVYENGLFAVKNEFWAEIFTKIMLASEGITDADIDEETMAEAVAEIQGMMDTLKLTIGFEITSNEVSKMVLSIDADAEAMQEADMVAPGTDAHVKLSVTFRLMDQGKTLKGMSANIDMYEENNVDMNLLLNADLIYKAGQVVGIDMSVNGTIKGNSVDYLYTEDDDGNIISEGDVLGDMTISAKIMINLGITQGKDVFTLDVSYDIGNIRATNGYSVDEEEYEQSMEIEFAMKAETLTRHTITGALEMVSAAEEIAAEISGVIYLDSAPSFPTEIPEIIQDYMN